ncbi:hypothetical protein MACK_000338 [Theileria orientalis]|uniref:Uncharacterized protein n=1 Tax=Theileria orientalis TaxID=68886 RepID=A0A976MBX8_THEOR|nr:hypothetical protein MACK_000338 [Theileria orientalis]
MDLYLRHFILFYLGCINLVKSNPLETLYLDVDIRLIESAASGGGSTRTGYTFEGSESVDVLSSGMFGGVISSEPIDESLLFFTYNHDKLLLQSYKVDNCTYYKLSPHVPGTIKTIFRGIFMVWESKEHEVFMYMVFTEPVKNELIIHLFVRSGNCFKRYVYNTHTKIFYYVRSSKTIYTMLPSKSSEECRAEARAVTHSKLVPRSNSPPNPEKKKLILKIPEAVRERARRREKELMEKGVLRYVSKSKESQTSSQGTGKEKTTGDQQGETSANYQMLQESIKNQQSEQEPSTSSGVDKERSKESVHRPTPSWFNEHSEFMHDPVLVEVIERHKYKAKYSQFLTRKEKLRKEPRKGVPKKLEVREVSAGSDNDDDTSGDGKLVIDEDSQTQTQEEKSDKDEKKEESKRKGKGKRKSQGQRRKKPDDDDKPEGGSGQGGAAAGGSGTSQSSGYNLRSTSGTRSRSRESTGDRSSDTSGESNCDKDKNERVEDEGRQGHQYPRGALITQNSLSDLNRPRIIGPGNTVNLEYVLRAHGSRQFAAMYHSDSEYLNYPVDPHILRNYPKSAHLEDDEDDVDCHLQISDDDEDPTSPLRQELLSKDDRRVPDQGQEAIGKVTEITEPVVSEPPREPRPYEQSIQSSYYTGDPAVVIRAIERFIRPDWDQPGTSGTYSRGQGTTSTYPYSVTQQTAASVEGSQAIQESPQFYHLQQPYQSYQSSQFFRTGESHSSYLEQQSYQTQPEQSVPESQETRGSHILCIRGPKSKHPLVFPSSDPVYGEAENQVSSDFRLHLESSTESSPCKRPLMSYQTEAQQLDNYNVVAIPTQSNQNENAKEQALGAVAAPMGMYNQGMVVPSDVPYQYQAPCFSPVSSEEGSAARPESEYGTPSADVQPPQEPGPSTPTQQAEGGAASAPSENKGDKVKKKKKHVRKTRVVRKTVYPQSFLPYYIAANTHGYMECEDMIPSLPILPLMPEPEDVVESYTETETDSDDQAKQGRDSEDTDSADESRSLADNGRQIPDPRSPRPTRCRSSRIRQPEPPREDESACTIS